MRTIESLYNKHYSKLSENDLYIFNYIMKQPSQIARIAIGDLAKDLAVSKSTLSRFTQKIGFSGFAEFKYFLNEALQSPPNTDEQKSGDLVMQDVEATYKLFKQANTRAIVKALYMAHNIFCYGTGWGQKTALDDIRRSMLVYNKYTVDISAKTELAMISRACDERDVLIITSLSGDVSLIEDQLQIFKSHGGTIVAITSIQASLLAQLADYTLYFQTTAMQYGAEEIVSFLPVSLVTNLLFLEYSDFIREIEGAPS